jgi:hypothetical protein
MEYRTTWEQLRDVHACLGQSFPVEIHFFSKYWSKLGLGEPNLYTWSVTNPTFAGVQNRDVALLAPPDHGHVFQLLCLTMPLEKNNSSQVLDESYFSLAFPGGMSGPSSHPILSATGYVAQASAS